MLRLIDDLQGLPSGRRVIKRAEFELYTEAQSILETAQSQAQQLQDDSSRAFEEQKTIGFQQGLANGSQAAASRLLQLEREIALLREQLKLEAAELIMHGVRSVLGEFDDSELVARIARELARDFRTEDHLRLRVHPTALESARAAVDQLLAEFPDGSEIQVQVDDNLSPSSCVLESATGIVDGSVDVQLAVLADALREALTDDAAGEDQS